MSSTALPITPARFAAALRDLTLPSLYAKAIELQNSIAHLRRSINEMQPLVDAGDADFAEHIWDNLAVIRRHEERLDLLKREIEERGFRWDLRDDGGVEQGEMGPGRVSPGPEEEEEERRGAEGTGAGMATGTGETAQQQQQTATHADTQARPEQQETREGRGGGGSLDDAELARRLAEQMREDGNADEDEGVYL